MTARVIAGVGLVIAAAMALIVFEQHAANDRILSTLNDVNAALANQTTRSRELERQVASLSERVGSLEKEVIDLRRRVVTLARRPVTVARSTPLPLDGIALAPLAPWPQDPRTLGPQDLRTSGPQDLVIETLPITWATDWRAYQPAGIIAPPAPIVLQRKLTDPAFVKKLYAGYVALQMGDVITTTVGLSQNASEANPLLRDIARSPVLLVGAKAAATVVTIYTMEKLRKRHPVVASVTLIAMNATLAAVTINNVSVATRENRAKP